MNSNDLILREEDFGGILFDPSDGSFVEIDQDGCDVMKSFAKGSIPKSFKSWKFLWSISKEVNLRKPIRVHRPDRDLVPIDGVKVYSSPTLVDFQITNKCYLDCPHCYASSGPSGAHVPFEDIRRILGEMADLGVLQVAIGGGEPLLHPDIERILQVARSNGIVPNVTTLGHRLSQKTLAFLKKYCGAVALSLEGVGDEFSERRKSGFTLFKSSLQKLIDAEIPTVLQITLSRENLKNLPGLVEFCSGYPKLYGVIFLAYKSVGRGDGFNNPLSHVPKDILYPKMRDAFQALSKVTRVGYDCCFSPGIAGFEDEFNFSKADSIEGCSATRSSLGITSDLEVFPCTFTTHRKVGDLTRESLKDVWLSALSQNFRQKFHTQVSTNSSCRTCHRQANCLGGCPEFSLINCNRDYLGARGEVLTE